MDLKIRVQKAHRQFFGRRPTWIVRSPGRVNLIGEHTDYNDGYVLPMAIDRAAWIAFSERLDSRVVVHSLDLKDCVDFDLTDLAKGQAGWGEYVKGLAWAYQHAGVVLQGWQGVIAGDIPIGAGLSSSAALELSVARAFSLSAGNPWQPLKAAELSLMAEEQWVGTHCGIMDQMVSALGERGKALWIDCRSLVFEPVPLPQDMAVVILDTGTRRELVESQYNQRRLQCEAAAAALGVSSLRDIGMNELHCRKPNLDTILYRRALHVVSENQRVLAAVDALHAHDPQRFGRLMNQSHTSLRDNFEVSSNELDAIVESANLQPGCFGARMTGAGFGGCALAWVEKTCVDDFIQRVKADYAASMGLEPEIYVATACGGTSIEARIED